MTAVPPEELSATNVIGLRINDNMIDWIQWLRGVVRFTPQGGADILGGEVGANVNMGIDIIGNYFQPLDF